MLNSIFRNHIFDRKQKGLGVDKTRRTLIHALGSSTLLMPCSYLLAEENENVGSSNPDSKSGLGKKSAFLVRDFNNTYLELVRLLKEVTEIEHALMVQYLYAAFSVKPKYSKIVGNGAPVATDLLGIAVQEMQHLGAVNRLLVELGGSPNMDIQDFPYEPDIYPTPMHLESLSRKSLARYVYAEAPASAMRVDSSKSPADIRFIKMVNKDLGTRPSFNHVASVYELVISLFKQANEQNPNIIADSDKWLERLKHIMLEGEELHFTFFKQLYLAEHPVFAGNRSVWSLPVKHSDYPAHELKSNPSAYRGHAGEIENEYAQALAWLGNLHYWTMLILLDFHYRHDDKEVKALAQTVMMTLFQGVAMELPKYGYGMPFDRLSLGYSPFPQAYDNLLLAVRFQEEAQQLTQKLGSDLPANYPKAMSSQVIGNVTRVAQRWRKKEYAAKIGNKVTMMNMGLFKTD